VIVESPAVYSVSTTKNSSRRQITVFHCFNATKDVSFTDGDNYEIKSVKLPCSSMTREIVLLKAFEAGADAVVLLVCPEGSCRYIEGNIRAKKRVTRMKKLLDEIGIDGRRLNIYNIDYGDQPGVDRIISQNVADLSILGPNPANLGSGS
jgi:F420-non-reducing hydrogenase iron-sulfur subunit